MSDEISWIFEVTLKPGALDEFRALAGEMVQVNGDAEPDTLGYHVFVSQDGRVHFYERYRDSAAAKFHVGRFAENFASRVLALADVTRFEIYGTPDAELKKTLDGFGAKYFTETAGFEHR